jgi:hypothetical protein
MFARIAPLAKVGKSSSIECSRADIFEYDTVRRRYVLPRDIRPLEPE